MFRNAPAMAGFAAGALACLMLAAAGHVAFTGHGIGDTAPRAQIVYPNW